MAINKKGLRHGTSLISNIGTLITFNESRANSGHKVLYIALAPRRYIQLHPMYQGMNMSSSSTFNPPTPPGTPSKHGATQGIYGQKYYSDRNIAGGDRVLLINAFPVGQTQSQEQRTPTRAPAALSLIHI